MYSGFPVKFISLLKCPHDGGMLQVLKSNADVKPAGHINDGSVECESCKRIYRICEGIISFIDDALMDEKSSKEKHLRDERAVVHEPTAQWELENIMEMYPTIEMLKPSRNEILLELGCGTGRYTLALESAYSGILAVDFSRESLRKLSSKLAAPSPVGLVHADIFHFEVASEQFDTVFATLSRKAMYRVAASALKENGKFVFSVEHYTLREFVYNVPKSGYYEEVEFYRFLYTRGEIRRETRNYFCTVQTRTINVVMPFSFRLRVPVLLVGLSFIMSYIPVLSSLGRLMLVEARNPIRMTG